MKKEIGIKENPHYPGIEVKFGENQFSQHSHIHQTWSLSYVLSGKTVVSLGTYKSELHEDQFITIPSGIPHLCSPETDNPFSFAVLYLPIDYLNDSMEFSKPGVGKTDSEVMFNLIDQFIKAENKEELNCASKKLQSLLNKKSKILGDDWGDNLLDKNFTSDQIQGSRFQQYRESRKHFGIGQKKISTIEKMEQAKELLINGGELVDIALECGFYDQSHFSKVFKLYTGLTPAQYINK